jgi:DNA-binding transcriptional regulator LsrR (DeoR family)
MPATRLTIRKIREVLRLFFNCHLTKRQIATSCKIARSTVSEGSLLCQGLSVTV